MTEPTHPDERLAALLDGRLDPRAREELLARLSADDEDYRVFAETAAILREAEEEDAAAEATPAPAGVTPLRPRRAPPVRRWLAAAAVVAAVTLASVAVLRGRGGLDADPVALAGQLAHAGEGLPAGWTDARPWSSARGDASAAGLPAGVRAGALLMDLAVAVDARDSAATHLLARQLADRFDRAAARGGALGRLQETAGGEPDALRPLVSRAADRLAERLGDDALALGAWAEAARLAARREDAVFFADGPTEAMLERAAQLAPEDAAAAGRVRVLLAGDPPAWSPIADAADALLGALAEP